MRPAKYHRIGFRARHELGLDLRYRDDPNFRRSEAERYVRFEGTDSLSGRDILLIPYFCSYEIKKVRAWNSLSSFERCLYKIADLFLSRSPNSNASAAKFFVASMIATGAILYGAYTNKPKIVFAAALAMIPIIRSETHSDKR